MRLIFGHDEKLAAWAVSRIPVVTRFSPCRAIGIADDDNHLLAVVVYHEYLEKEKVCSVSIATDSPRWATKGIIKALLSVPFEQYKVRKLYSQIESSNKKSLRLNLGLGFKQEAVLRHHFGYKRHCIVTSLMAGEYWRIYGGAKIILPARQKSAKGLTG